LISRVERNLDSETGLYDQQIFVHAYAMLALSAAGEVVPAAAISALEGHQVTDGSWAFTGSTEYPASAIAIPPRSPFRRWPLLERASQRRLTGHSGT
jgi:hypothetical protein